MMNIADEDIDLGLSLGSTSHCAECSSGAGVNAQSRADIAFAASDPLSELVWSPHNGLSLKCADSSLAESKPFLPWNVEPTIRDLSTLQTIKSKGIRDGKVVREEKLTMMLDGGGGFCDKTTLYMSSRGGSSSGNDGKMEDEAGTTDAIQEEGNRKDNREADLCGSQNVQIADVPKSSKKNAARGVLVDGTNESKFEMGINWQFSSKLIRRTHCEFKINADRSDIMGLAVPVPSEPHAAKLSEALICSLPNLQFQQEPDDEVTSTSLDMNKNKTTMPISFPAPALMKMESSAENYLADLAAKEMRLSREDSPTKSRICLHGEKGKGIALSDGDLCRKSSNDEDNSHESVESCNSAGLFSKGVKRQSYDQEQLIGSKRMKRQIQESDSCTSLVRPDSSFMNWMSSMVKGLPDVNKEESSSLTLALARPIDLCGNNHRESLMCNNKTHDCESRNMGFQTVFQSLYCRNAKMSGSGVQKNNVTENLMIADKESPENPQQSFERNKDNSCKQIILSNEDVNPHTSGNIVGQPAKPWILSEDFACDRSLEENKASVIPVCTRAIGEVSLSDSLCKWVTSNAENTSLNFPLAVSCMPEKSNPTASLWITRLYTGTARLENCNQITEEARECSTECPKANLDSRVTGVLCIDQKICVASNDSGEDEVHATESTRKPCPVQLSQKLRSSEAMASVFVKRLDALRHIIQPSEKREFSTCLVICFFCGRSGHDLRKCPQLTESELEDLIVKISSFERVEESPCLCIRCFQLDHWAVSCPLATWNVKDSPRKRLSTSNEFQKSITSNSENDLKDKQIFPLCNFVRVVQEEMFDAIRRLRLSRSDILRWMTSNVSLSHLSGFFLRLRLGKLEAGLGWTGYYVACITGDTIENIGCNSKKSILVDVGGIKSSIGSQFVSNNDFLEDEIKAWWSRIVKSGGKIPSLDELNSKLQDKKCLGL